MAWALVVALVFVLALAARDARRAQAELTAAREALARANEAVLKAQRAFDIAADGGQLRVSRTHGGYAIEAVPALREVTIHVRVDGGGTEP